MLWICSFCALWSGNVGNWILMFVHCLLQDDTFCQAVHSHFTTKSWLIKFHSMAWHGCRLYFQEFSIVFSKIVVFLDISLKLNAGKSARQNCWLLLFLRKIRFYVVVKVLSIWLTLLEWLGKGVFQKEFFCPYFYLQIFKRLYTLAF